MPTYNVAIGIYNRTNGIDPLYEPILIYDLESDLDGDGEASMYDDIDDGENDCVLIIEGTDECIYEEYESLSPYETRYLRRQNEKGLAQRFRFGPS